MSETDEGPGSVPSDSGRHLTTVVLLHGLFGDRDNLRGLGDRLGAHAHQRRPIVRLDLPAHGEACAGAAPLTLDAMADAIAVAVQQAGIDNAAGLHLVGHSLGGKVAMTLAARGDAFAARLASLTILDIGPAAYAPHHRPLIDALLQVPLDTIASRRDADRVLARAISEAPVRAFLLKSLARDDTGWRWRFDLATISRDYEACLTAAVPAGAGAVDLPALFVAGGRSDYLADTTVTSLRTRWPLAQLTTVEGAGHWLHAERPDDVAKRVAEFLQQHER